MRAGKRFTLFFSNEDMNDINWWSYWISKTWNKKTRIWISWRFLTLLAASIEQPMICSVVKGISERGVRRAGRGYNDKNV